MKLTKERKQEVVDALAYRLAASPNFYLTDFTGIAVKPMTELRRRIREAGGEYVVVKNTLALRAFSAAELAGLEELFRGPTGVVFAGSDPVVAAKVLADFRRDHESLAVKAGVVEGRPVTGDEVARLAALPPRPVLLGQVAGAFQAPLQGFVGVLTGLLSGFAGALEALRAERVKG